MRSRPRLPFTIVNYTRKFTGVNGCGHLRLYSLPVRPAGAPCRKVVRQWDFTHCTRKNAPVGGSAGVLGVWRGWVLPQGGARAPVAAPSSLLVRLVRSLLLSPSCSRLAALRLRALGSFGSLPLSFSRCVVRPRAPLLTAPMGAALARPHGAVNERPARALGALARS